MPSKSKSDKAVGENIKLKKLPILRCLRNRQSQSPWKLSAVLAAARNGRRVKRSNRDQVVAPVAAPQKKEAYDPSGG
jgi:hypothetical protein